MKKIALDTNIFFNMEADLGLGDSTLEISKNIKKALQKYEKGSISIITTPGVASEIKSFFDNEKDESLQNILGFLTIQSPSVSDIKISASIFEKIIEDYRERSYRAMKVAEEEMLSIASSFMGKEALRQKEFQMTSGKFISNFRDRYRNATRTGTIDSVADFELLLLAKEQDAPIVTTDKGLLYWGRIIGIQEMDPSVFGKKMKEYL